MQNKAEISMFNVLTGILQELIQIFSSIRLLPVLKLPSLRFQFLFTRDKL